MSVGAVNKQTGDRIPTAGMPAIDDALDLTSVNPVQNAIITAALADKQDKTDNSLQTTNKTVVGAINEHEGDIDSLKSGLTNVNVALDVPVGSGKNLLPLSISDIKRCNTLGSWADNVYTYNGITFTVNLDSNGNIASIKATGTASANADFILADYNTTNLRKLLNSKNVTLNGCPANGSSETYSILGWHATSSETNARDRGNGITFDAINMNSSFNFAISIASGYSIATAGLLFYPMVRLSTITDPTFAPYIPSVESRIEAVESETTNTYDFSTPSGYNAGGRVISDKFGNMVILRFVDYIPTAPSGKVELFGGLPQATNGQTTQFFNIGNQTSFKVLIDTDGKLYSYYNADKTGSTDVYNGQLVYFTK